MKKTISLFICFILIFSVLSFFPHTARATVYGACGDGLTWEIDVRRGILTISGEGDMYDFYRDDDTPWYYNYPDISYVVIEDGVTSIGECAFYYCGALYSVTIGNSVTSIGESAFQGCVSIESIVIPDNLTRIGYRAFEGCASLASLSVGRGLASLGYDAFSGCPLDRIAVDGENAVFHSSGNCLIETESKKLIAGCNNSVIPSDGSVTSIENYAFCGRKALTEITIPDGVTSVGHRAFEGCAALTSISIPDSVTSIGRYAFSGCSSLTDVFFSGSKVEWDNVDIMDPDDTLLSATIHYGISSPAPVSITCGGVLLGPYTPGDEISLPVPETVVENGATKRFFTWLGTEVIRSAFSAANETPNGRTYTMTVPDSNVELTAEYVLVGDVGGDGFITLPDLSAMKIMIAGTGEAGDRNLEAADINFDGLNTLSDIALFKLMLAGSYTPEG